MQRWHKLRKGRIVESVDCEDGDRAEAMLGMTPNDLIVSDEDWRDLHHKRALRHHGPPLPTFADLLARIQP